MSQTFLTTDELAARIKYEPRYIRETLNDAVFIEGVHYIRPFGGRKILYLWEIIEEEMLRQAPALAPAIPLARGGVCRG